MKLTFILLLFASVIFSCSSVRAAAIAAPAIAPAATATVDDLVAMDRSELEHVLGRRLKLTERIAFSIAKRKLARQLKRQDQDAAPTTNGMAVAGFVCGVVGLFLFGIVLGPLAIIFSAIGLSKSNKEGRPLRGLAIAGLVLGIVATLGWIIVIAAVA